MPIVKMWCLQNDALPISEVHWRGTGERSKILPFTYTFFYCTQRPNRLICALACELVIGLQIRYIDGLQNLIKVMINILIIIQYNYIIIINMHNGYNIIFSKFSLFLT